MAIDIDQSHYNTGTATVAGAAVTGQGTTWLGAVRPGDLFGTHKGSGVRISSVNSNTSLTLAYAVTGLNQTAAIYEIQRTPFDVGYLAAIEDMIRLYGVGNLPSLAALDGTGGNKLVGLTGAGTAAAIEAKLLLAFNALDGTGGDKGVMLDDAGSAVTFALTAFARTLLDDENGADALTSLGATPFWQERFTSDLDAAAARAGMGANNASNLTTGTLPDGRVSAALTPDKAFRRGNILGAVSQTGGVPSGALIDAGSNANGNYVRFADGTQLCWAKRGGTVAPVAAGSIWRDFSSLGLWTFPAGFVAAPAITCTALSSVYWISSTAPSPTATAGFTAFCYSNVPTPLNFDVLAIGRWF